MNWDPLHLWPPTLLQSKLFIAMFNFFNITLTQLFHQQLKLEFQAKCSSRTIKLEKKWHVIPFWKAYELGNTIIIVLSNLESARTIFLVILWQIRLKMVIFASKNILCDPMENFCDVSTWKISSPICSPCQKSRNKTYAPICTSI